MAFPFRYDGGIHDEFYGREAVPGINDDLMGRENPPLGFTLDGGHRCAPPSLTDFGGPQQGDTWSCPVCGQEHKVGIAHTFPQPTLFWTPVSE